MTQDRGRDIIKNHHQHGDINMGSFGVLQSGSTSASMSSGGEERSDHDNEDSDMHPLGRGKGDN
jgi:hypothetical protein